MTCNTEDSRGDSGQCPSKAMSRYDDSIAGIGAHGRFYLRCHAAGYGFPGIPETLMYLAARAEIAGVDPNNVEIGNPVLKIPTAPKGEDEVLISRVDCQIARCITKGTRSGFDHR